MTIRILNRTVAALSAAVILSACGGGGDSAEGRASDPSAQSQGLVYAFPGDGQTEVSTASPVILRFTSSVNVGDAMSGITLYEGGADGRAMNPEFEPVQGQPNNLMLVPEENDPFKPNQQYTLVIEDLPLGGNGTAENRTLQFTTRALHEGPKELVVTDMDNFRITGAFPNFENDNLGGEQRFQAMDFSSFRFQMSQPVDRATAVYGQSVTLTYGPDDTEVPATLLIDGRYITVDPEPEYLDSTQTYELTLTGDLASTYGANFTERSFRFTPQDTSPRGEPTRLVQRLTVNEPSKLTGRDVNTVPVNGTLLGEDENVTQARADSVIAELGDATVFSRTTPIRLPKGTILKGDAINPILIGGKVPAGFGSGEVTMTLLSDATGYLVQNRYMEDGENVSRMIQLMMDVGIATAEPRANGAFTQDLLHIELVGLADIDTSAGVLNVDAVSVVEPDILGQEYGYGLLSFQLQSYEDQTIAPQPMADTAAPVLQSWVPGDNNLLAQPNDPIILNFNEPVDSSIAQNAIRLLENGVEKEVNITVDGAAVVVRPVEALKYSVQGEEVDYVVEIADEIKDIAGNAYTAATLGNFSLAPKVAKRTKSYPAPGAESESLNRSPIVLSAYPGFPCALEETDLEMGDAGRCVGSFPGVSQADWPSLDLFDGDIQPEDDHLPIMDLPQNRSITIQFSKDIDADSVILGESFKVQAIDVSGNVLNDVDGELALMSRRLAFTPREGWVDGQLYRYVLQSNGDAYQSAANCDGSGAICDQDGLPLKTNYFADLTVEPASESNTGSVPERALKKLTSPKPIDSGGPDMIQYFKGAPKRNSVVQTLYTLPFSDTNGNMVHEADVELMLNSAQGFLGNVGSETVQYSYDVKEGAVTDIADPYSDETLDPGGVRPIPNSSKVLSENKIGGPPDANGQSPLINGITIGCGPEQREQWYPDDPNSTAFYSVAYECPKNKFTYLLGGLTAEVTDEYEPGKGLKVLIWPAQVTGTALVTYSRIGALPFYLVMDTGPQILRMRYEENEQGRRVNPITAWIEDGANGPVLNADVDLYLDVPELSPAIPVNNPTHTLISLPLTMNLSGDVRFLEDGRMVVEQYNVGDVVIDLSIFGSSGSGPSFPLVITDHGNFLQFVSDPIK